MEEIQRWLANPLVARTIAAVIGLLIIGVLGMLFDRVLIRRIEQATIVRWGMTEGR